MLNSVHYKKCFFPVFTDKSLGVFHYRSPMKTYKLNYTMAQEACKKAGGTIATYEQLSYAQQVALSHENTRLLLHLLVCLLSVFSFALQAGYNLCAAGWLEKARVAYPMSFSNPKCGFGHVGIVDYGTRSNLSETWDAFCYRVNGRSRCWIDTKQSLLWVSGYINGVCVSDVKCECKTGYVGDGYSCTGNLLQVLSTTPTFSNFYSVSVVRIKLKWMF